MQLKWIRYAVWVAGLAGIAVIGADLHRQYRRRGETFSLPALPPSLRLSRRSPEKRLENYEAVFAGHLFHTPSPEPARASETPSLPQRLDLELVGVISDPDRPICLIRAQGKTHILTVGERLPDGSEVTRITETHVLLSREGKTEILRLEEKALGGGRKGAPSLISENIRQDAPDHFTIDRRLVEEKIADFGSLLTEVGINPVFNEDGTSGIRLSYIAKESVLNDIGLKRGDVIEGVNGEPITSLEQGFEIFQRFQTERNLTLTVRRRGETKELHYEIR